jgi:hypothetical protein
MIYDIETLTLGPGRFIQVLNNTHPKYPDHKTLLFTGVTTLDLIEVGKLYDLIQRHNMQEQLDINKIPVDEVE